LLSGSWEKDFYNINFPILAQVKTHPWPHLTPSDHAFYKQMSEIKLSFYDPVVLEKKNQNIFPM
jgi:hypothetical protein